MIRVNSFVGVSLLAMGLGAMAGCGHDTTAVPSSATQVVSGGKIVAFTAPHDGRAFLRDESDKRIIYSTDVKKDQVIKFDPQEKNVTIDGRVAAEKLSDPNHDHSIFFERASQPDHADAMSVNNPGDNANPSVPVVRVPVGVQLDVQTQPSQQQPQK